MDTYFLSPFSTITKKKKGYGISSLMEPKKEVYIDSLRELVPENKKLLDFIFFKRTNKNIADYMENSLEKLEKLFKKQKTTAGYIETTKNCPYHCQICPKSWDRQNRMNIQMSVDNFEKIIKQIPKGETIALHLFGDPLFDKDLFQKIAIANDYGIIPSFSTNLVSLLRIDITKFIGLKLNTLIISFDSYEEQILSKIRGHISHKQIDKAKIILKELDELADNYKFVKHIEIQQIMLKNNSEEKDKLVKFAESGKKMIFVPKKYINFPLVDSCEIGTQEIVNIDEKILLYRVIGQRTPFLCLKPWIKKEIGITTDGKVVPCCLSLNATANIGNAFDMSLNEIFRSKAHEKFRKEIFFNTISQDNYTCKNCNVYKQQAIISGLSDKAFYNLKKYVIPSWSVYNEN